MTIHPTAVVEEGAQLGAGVRIGPYCVIGADVVLGDGVILHAHASVAGRTEIGPRTVVHPFAVLGGPPQHIAWRGEDTRLVIGADCVIREHATMNIGTRAGRGVTTVGAGGYFMTACHIGHDCVVGDNVIMANCATLGGHVVIEDHVFLGGLSAIHQHCRVGTRAFIGGCAAVAMDVIPYGSAIGNHAALAGLNVVGMKRAGMARAAIHDIRGAYRMLFEEGGAPFSERLAEVEAKYGGRAEVRRILDFARSDAKRPLMGPAR